jgi:heterogeneous nuclear ribonucleoprotein A1/A3
LRSSQDITRRKIFICKLDPSSTSQSLHQAFRHFGEIIEAAVIYDKNTKNSKGYGFVTFVHAAAAENALRDPFKNIDGKVTEVC